MFSGKKSRRFVYGCIVFGASYVLIPFAWSQDMEAVGQPVREDAVRRALEANLKITETKVKELQGRVDAMKVCYEQGKMYAPTGCVALPPQKKNCSCSG